MDILEALAAATYGNAAVAVVVDKLEEAVAASVAAVAASVAAVASAGNTAVAPASHSHYILFDISSRRTALTWCYFPCNFYIYGLHFLDS